MTKPEPQNLPFLRALKCAYKLHKAGLTDDETRMYLLQAGVSGRDDFLPSAATPVEDLLPATFNFEGSIMGAEYWQPIQNRLQGVKA